MEFNFSEEFKNLSNIDLLKVVLRPSEYEKEAVEAAATKILQTRQVSEDETAAVKNYYDETDAKKQSQNKKMDSLKKELSKIVEPQTEIKPSYWIKIFLIAVAIQYLILLFNAVKHFLSLLNSNTQISSFDFVTVANIIYIPIIFYLIFKRKKWGWILLFADNLVSSILCLSEIFLYFQSFANNSSFSFLRYNPTSIFIFLIIKAAFLYFLWRNEIAAYFHIASNTKKKTSILTAMLTLAFMIMVYLITR